jgi:hypothetical protein
VANCAELDFGEIPVAFKKTQEILIKNVGTMEEPLQLQALTPFGGFSVLNAMRTIKPGETKPVVVQFEPHARQVFEERINLYSEHTVVSVMLKGTGVRPEVKVEPEDRLIAFRDVLLGEFAERTFTIENISSFPVSFNLQLQASGIMNKSKQYPFTLIPSQGTIAANSTYEVKVIFQPDLVNDNYFEVLLIDIPNQLHPKEVYLRGQCYSRQMAIREYVPFEWRPLDELKKRYEEPL